MRRERCENCHKLSEETGLRWAGTNMGYIKLCDSCTNDFRRGKFKVVKEEGKLKIQNGKVGA
jgi:hypothetical protein